jgi:amino acid adenylation domain-containing protein/non-ribosomal peptide synthase protein (TIGR01720 family)
MDHTLTNHSKTFLDNQEEKLLIETKQYKLLVEWNNTQSDYPRDKCIHQLFEEQVKRSPNSIAVVFEGEQLTYGELNAKANQLAHYLQALGVKPETLVGICVERSLEMVVGLLGILKAGSAYVPLDPAYPSERLAFMLEDSRVPVLLTSIQQQKILPQQSGRIVYLDKDWEEIVQHSDQNPCSKVVPNNLAYVMYTSGSTGKPKGVSIVHKGVVRLVKAANYANFDAEETFLQLAPISFDASTFEIWGSLLNGARLVVMPPYKASLQELGQVIIQYQVTTLWLTAGLFHLMVDEQLESLKNVRQLLAGGDVLSVPHVKKVLQELKGCTLINGYGPTENTTFSCCYKITDFSLVRNSVPIGHPIANTQVYLLDEKLQPVPVGVPGELYIGGDGLARGYLNRPNLTQKKFIVNPFSNQPNSRLYKTGDLGRYLPDGNIEFIGRIDNQVKIRGFRIELSEIETLLRQHPDVRETVIIVTENITNDKQLVAYIVPYKELAPTIGNLRSFLKEQLPDYMLPSAFVTLDSLPLTPNGKVDRRALPAPEFQPEFELSFVAPRTPVEEILASIWASVLALKQVGIYDNFFELGGHSLLATQAISRVRDALAIEIPLRSFFEAPTIAALARCIQGALTSGQPTLTPPLVLISRPAQIPLSFAQARLWFLDRLQPENPFYNIPLVLRLSGQLNVVALEQSLNEIIRRHENLRTNFTIKQGQPVQIVATILNLQLVVVDLQNLPACEQAIETQRLVSQLAVQHFDLEREHLLRASVLKLSSTEYVFVLVLHHIITDGWSLGVLERELSTCYEAFYHNNTPVLPKLPVQYADFALWQRNYLTGEILQKQLNYWQQQLNGIPTLLELPLDRPRPAVQSYRGAHSSIPLSAQLSQELVSLSKRMGVTLFMTLLTAFQTLLYRYTGSDDIVVGTPIANRNQQEIEGLIGFFVNTLVLRTDLSGNPSFEQLLIRVREVSLGAYAHQDLPFEELVEALRPERSLSHSPLFQVMFTLENTPKSCFDLHKLTVSSLAVETPTAKFDLTLSMQDSASGLIGVWEYNTDLFNADTIARMALHLQTILEAIIANPKAQISKSPMLTEAERQQLLVEWNKTQKEYSQDKCIHQLFEEQVERSPDAVAVVFEGEQLTYRELNARANQLAHYLQALGVEPEKLVGICVERSSEMVVGLLGILKAGGAYVPLDPTHPSERLSLMLKDCSPPVIITQKTFVEKLLQHQVRTVCLDFDWEEIAHCSKSNLANSVVSNNLAYVIYTSGSTGKPKGVPIEHKNTVALLTWAKEIFTNEDISGVLASTSICFDLSVFELFVPLSRGGSVILAQNALSLPTLPTANQVTLINTVPSAIAELLRLKGIPPGVRTINLAGESLQNQIVQQLYRQTNVRKVFNLYGPSEDTTYSTFSLIKKGDSCITIGRPIANTQVYVLDKKLQPVPVGVLGELHIGGDGLAHGYLNLPDLTAEKFIPNPFSNKPGERLYKTGDLVRYLPDGNIEFKGRIDNQVKIRGFRIELGEIETVISQHPLIKETVVIAAENNIGNKQLVAYIVPHKELAHTIGDLRGFLKEQLPNYMLPSAFVTLDSLPLTPNGKIDRRVLPACDTYTFNCETPFIRPRTPTEKILATIWASVLQLEQVGIQDNFFELGGDSILSIQIVARCNTAGLKLTPKDLFGHQTIASLAQVVSKSEEIQAEQDVVTGAVPLTPILHWFLEQKLSEPNHFNQSFIFEVSKDLKPELLKQALQQLLVHHDALRLWLIGKNDNWQLQNAADQETEFFSIVDLSGIATSEQTGAIEAAATELQASLNLSSGSITKVTLFNLGNDQPNRLLIVIHHLAVDGVSWRILLEDLATAYQQIASKQAIVLPAKTTSFQDWAVRLTQYANSQKAVAELNYWLAQFDCDISPLPLDYPLSDTENTIADAAQISVSLSVEQTLALLKEVPRAYNTQINDVLLTALLQCFAQWTGESSLLINLEGHGREELFEDVNLSRTVGWFTSIFPVLLKLDKTDLPLKLLKSVKEQLRRIPQHGIGYGILRYLSSDQTTRLRLQHLPTAQVSFNYLGQFDQMLNAFPILGLASESSGSPVSLKNSRSHLLEIDGFIAQGKLQLTWTYNQKFHTQATVERLAQSYIEALTALISDCLSSEVGGYTPSDFPEAELTQEELDELVESLTPKT